MPSVSWISPPAPGVVCFEQFEDARREDVAADDGLLRRRVFELRLLHHAGAVVDARVFGIGRAGQHAVGGDGGAFDGLRSQHGPAALVEDVDHLLQAGDLGVDHIVGQDDGEGFIADQFLGAENGVAQAERLLLAHVADARQRGDTARDREQFLLAAALERRVELEAEVEVVFHGAFAAAGDDDDVLDAGGNGLFDAVLDDGLVDQRQHLLGNDLGGRQKARAQAACGEDRFANLLCSSHLRSLKQ